LRYRAEKQTDRETDVKPNPLDCVGVGNKAKELSLKIKDATLCW